MALSVQIQKRLGGFLLEVAFETDGAPIGLLGASGCGKSVTLNCIAGIMKPDAGRIELNGRVLFDSERRIDLPPQKRNIGYLFQQYALFPNMTVEQNILAGVRTGTRSEKRAAAKAAIRTFRLEGAERQYPHTLSGGQQQRAALARILVGRPEALLLDEPFSSLDSFLKWQLAWELIEYLKPYAGDVVFVSHDRDEVRRLCETVCVLDNGRSEPRQRMQTLLNEPGSIAAARLAGCRNIGAAVKGEDGTALCPVWNVELRIPATDEPFAAVGLPEQKLHPAREGEPNAFDCRVLGTAVEAMHMTVLLRPYGAASNVLLCMRASEPIETGRVLAVAIAPEDVLPLR